MSDPQLREALGRYLRQRIEAGERERLLVKPLHSGAAVQPTAAELPARAPQPAASVAPDVPVPATTAPAASIAALPGDSLEKIAAEVAACKRCRLHATRTRAVPGVGAPNAGAVFIGEAPGAEEDVQGEPFVGAAGQLLNKILSAIGFRREDVFITNIIKCRPPNNRDPQPDEVACCRPYLERQLAIMRPKVICALGRHAGAWLTGAPDVMKTLRSGEYSYRGIRVFPTYHPAALLRNAQWKRPTWEDVQRLRAEYDRLSGNP